MPPTIITRDGQQVDPEAFAQFVAVAPGSGYGRGRQLHSEAHHHLTWRCDQCGAMAVEHEGNRCPDTEATP